MKRAVVLWASGLDDFGNELYERFSCFAPKEFQEYLKNTGSRQLVFAPDAPELKQAIAFCQQTGHDFKLYNHVHYSKKELENTAEDYLKEHNINPNTAGETGELCAHCGKKIWNPDKYGLCIPGMPDDYENSGYCLGTCGITFG